MAGMPPSLIERANDILKQLETKHVGESGQEPGVGSQESQSLSKKIKNLTTQQMQLSIFDAHTETFDEIRKLLTDIDINRLTPVGSFIEIAGNKE
jgi:DNA mismatch repair protein MutS